MSVGVVGWATEGQGTVVPLSITQLRCSGLFCHDRGSLCSFLLGFVVGGSGIVELSRYSD